MTKKSLFAAALLLLVGTAVIAKSMPKTIKIVAGSGKVMVNGKEYTPGTPLPKGAKITVTGDVTMQIGNVTITTSGGEFKMSGDSIRVVSGSAQVTNAAGMTQTVAAGQKVSVESKPAAPAQSQDQQASGDDSGTAGQESSNTLPPPPPPNPQQDTNVASPSAP